MRTACPVVLAVLLTISAETPQWAVPLYVNPESAEPGAEIAREVAARDYDRDGTNTWATKAFTRTCTPQGGCAGVSSASTVWTGFPAGYRPRKLTVHWKAMSSAAMFGGMSQVRAFIEYSTGGEVWTPVDRFAGGESLVNMPTKASEIAVSPATDPTRLKVRGRLEVEMISCPNEECRANLPNASNVSGQIWVSDIRLEVDNPVLTASGERVRKGDQVVFGVEGAPGAQVGDWTFKGASGKVVARIENLDHHTWPLDIVESGTVTVTVRLRGQPQLDGRIYKLSKPIEVRTRR